MRMWRSWDLKKEYGSRKIFLYSFPRNTWGGPSLVRVGRPQPVWWSWLAAKAERDYQSQARHSCAIWAGLVVFSEGTEGEILGSWSYGGNVIRTCSLPELLTTCVGCHGARGLCLLVCCFPHILVTGGSLGWSQHCPLDWASSESTRDCRGSREVWWLKNVSSK